MKCLVSIFVFAFALSLLGCSQGISTLDKRLTLIKNNATTISQRAGTARGNELSGLFKLKIWYGQLNCRSTSKYDAIEALEDDVLEVPCEQDDGSFECKWVDGSTYRGYIDRDGSFGLAGEFNFEIEEGVTTPAPTTATGIFSPDGKGTGSIMVAAKGQQVESKANCLITYSFELTKKEKEDDEKDSNSSDSTESLAMTFSMQGHSGKRLFRDLRVREAQRSVIVGAKGGSDERVVARLHPDGTAEVSARLVDRDNHPLIQGPVEGCTYEAEPPGKWALSCEITSTHP